MAADLSGLGEGVSASVRTVIANRSNTYIDRGYDMGSGKCGMIGGDIVWWSEEDGWGHLYRYNPQVRHCSRSRQKTRQTFVTACFGLIYRCHVVPLLDVRHDDIGGVSGAADEGSMARRWIHWL